MRVLRIAFIIVSIIYCQSSLSQSLPQIPTDGQACLVFQIIQSQEKIVEDFFKKQQGDTTDGSCFKLPNNYLINRIYYPKDNETFDTEYFGSTQNTKDSIHKIDGLLQKFVDTVQISEPAYAYCRCESNISCFEVRLSPIFRGVFSAEIRLQSYDAWKRKVSESKLIFTFMTEKDGDIIGYIPIDKP